jgi:hypothetical protein
MPRYEYKVVPAPKKGEKARGVKTPEDRFAHALTLLMNQLGADGWEYLRADSLPSEERSGFTGRTTVIQNLLVFRRGLDVAADAPRPAEPRLASRPSLVAPPAPAPEPTVVAVRRDPVDGATPRLGPARGSLGGPVGE